MHEKLTPLFFLGTNTVLYTMVCLFRHALSVSAASRNTFIGKFVYIYNLQQYHYMYISHYIHCISIFLFSVNTHIIFSGLQPLLESSLHGSSLGELQEAETLGSSDTSSRWTSMIGWECLCPPLNKKQKLEKLTTAWVWFFSDVLSCFIMSYPCPFTIWDGCMGWLVFFFQKYCHTKGFLFGCSKINPLIVGLLRPIHLRFVYQKEQSCCHLVNKHCYWTWPIDSGFSHEKMWFSRVFCWFTRGYPFLWTLARRMRLTVLTAVLQVGFIVSPCSFVKVCLKIGNTLLIPPDSSWSIMPVTWPYGAFQSEFCHWNRWKTRGFRMFLGSHHDLVEPPHIRRLRSWSFTGLFWKKRWLKGRIFTAGGCL